MGQIVTTAELQRFVAANVEAYITQATGPYSRLFAGAPTFVTYYSQDLARGSSDTNLGGSIEVVGPESALRYKAVFDFPIYGVPATDVTTAYDEIQGAVTSGIGGEAHLLPGTIQPYENDLFVIQYLETSLVFRVRSADPDRLEGKAFFRIGYFLDQASQESLSRQTTGEYQFEIAYLGTDASPIVERSSAIALREMAVVEEAVRAAYWRAFYNLDSSTLVLRNSPYANAVHDQALDMFVRRNDLLSTDAYLSSRVVVPPNYGDLGQFQDTVYPLTLYWVAERGESWSPTVAANVVNRLGLFRLRPLTPASPFFADFAMDGYSEAVPSPVDDGMPAVWVGGTSFLQNTTSGVLADATSYPARLLVQQCLLGAYRGAPAASKISSLASALNNMALLTRRSDFFWLVPIALMEAKRLRRAARETAN
jgi:hypothetical protein